jgi:arylsulfatase A-like enzyme
MRKGKWKLHEYFEDGALELYDLSADVGESKNLAGEKPEIVKSLRADLMRWRQEIKAPEPAEVNPKFDPAAEQAERKRLAQKSEKGSKRKRSSREQ